MKRADERLQFAIFQYFAVAVQCKHTACYGWLIQRHTTEEAAVESQEPESRIAWGCVLCTIVGQIVFSAQLCTISCVPCTLCSAQSQLQTAQNTDSERFQLADQHNWIKLNDIGILLAVFAFDQNIKSLTDDDATGHVPRAFQIPAAKKQSQLEKKAIFARISGVLFFPQGILDIRDKTRKKFARMFEH